MIQGNLSPFTLWKNEEKLLTTSSQKLSDDSVPCRSVRILAKATNTDKIYIGSENLTTSNYTIFLEANEAVEIEIEDINKIFLIAAINAEGVNYHYVI